MKILHTLALGVAASALMGTAAFAAETSTPYVAPTTPYMSSMPSSFGFEGFYAGVLLGGFFDGTSSYLTAPDTSALSAGLAVGVNFYLTDAVVGGVEVQGTVDFGKTAWVKNGLVLGKVGYAPTSDMMIYGTGGVGLADTSTVYAFGGGVEVAAMDTFGVRGEVLGMGTFGAAPNAVKATVGLIWHMQ